MIFQKRFRSLVAAMPHSYVVLLNTETIEVIYFFILFFRYDRLDGDPPSLSITVYMRI